MNGCTGPYARVYMCLVDDEKFADVYHDDAAFAAWVRLLMRAEVDWPRSSEFPGWLKPSVKSKLLKAGLIEAAGSGRYKIHGLDAERQKRSDAGRTGAKARWGNADRNADRIPTGNAEPMHERERELVREGERDIAVSNGARSNGRVDPVRTT
jgi:hypothetical protein